MIKEHAKQVMLTAIAHHSLNAAQPVPEQRLDSPGQLLQFYYSA